ncbi:MAG: retroviral-like aspartic protease family protein [Methylococcaceae bacterium]|nr:retroviral-like aspartic protease family protein [Methylococcaceae bacterium]MCI0667013.1 retroviral-like aspartic protease family protein [Methylococcaceae bacterium]MCI0732577.1 retroviral-like aspartic protease family protein [Methylococcaceae bacterium]
MTTPDFDLRRWLRILILLAGGSASCGAGETIVFRSLADQLDDLAYRNNITIDGLELTASQPPKRVTGDSTERVKRLLAEFNYVTILTSERSIERIIILGEKQVFPRGVTLHTRKKGKNHTIEGRVTGANGKQIPVSLVIDTGADYLVLPKSMMESFGVDPDSSETRKLQTANGLTDARIAKVKTLQIGNELIPDIEAAFIEDDQLGDSKLLGMNVLQRYRVTLDDREQTVTLIKVE